MSTSLCTVSQVGTSAFNPLHFRKPIVQLLPKTNCSYTFKDAGITSPVSKFRQTKLLKSRRRGNSPLATMLADNPFVSDILATAFSGVIALSFLRLWAETAKRGIFDQVKVPPCSFTHT